MACREIITVQCGSYANYTGQHFWNNQACRMQNSQQSSAIFRSTTNSSTAELNSEILHCRNRNSNGFFSAEEQQQQFSPRTVIIDLHGAWTSSSNDPFEFQTRSSLVEPAAAAANSSTSSSLALHGGRVDDIRRQQNISCSSTAAAAAGDGSNDSHRRIKSWSDFCRLKYPSRAFHTITNSGYQFYADRPVEPQEVQSAHHHQTSQVFDSYLKGQDCYRSQLFGEEEIEEPLRRYAEACTDLQGFNFLYDADDAFAGLASRTMLHLSDEYRSKTLYCWPLLPPHRASLGRFEQQFRLFNFSYSLANLLQDVEMTTLLTPLSFNSQQFESTTTNNTENSSWYNSSAVLATCLDTLLSPFCTVAKRNLDSTSSLPRQMHQLQAMISMYGRKVSSLSCEIPFPFNNSTSLYDAFTTSRESDNLNDILSTYSPLCRAPEAIGYNSSSTLYSCLRGIPEAAQRLSTERVRQLQLPHSALSMSGSDMLIDYLTSFLTVSDAAGSSATTTTAVYADVLSTPNFVAADSFAAAAGAALSDVQKSDIAVKMASLCTLSAPGSVGNLLDYAADGLRQHSSSGNRMYYGISGGLERDDIVRAERALRDVRDNYPMSENNRNIQDDDDDDDDDGDNANWA